MTAKIKIPFFYENGMSYVSDTYFSEDREDRFLSIGIADFLYRNTVNIKSYEEVINFIGKEKVINRLTEQYAEERKILKGSSFICRINLEMSEEELLYMKIKLDEDFNLFFDHSA